MNRNRSWPRLSALTVSVFLAACSSLPADVSPAIALPQPFAQGRSFESGSASGGWAVMGDPVLQALVTQGLAANLDLRKSAERVQRSRALAAARRADLSPSGTLGAGGRAQQLAQDEAPGASSEARRSELLSTGFNFNWEIDLFGRLRHQASAADARSEAVAADADALRMAVAAEIAQVWFAIDGAREQLRLTRGVIENRRGTLDLVQRRVAAGYSAPLDEARARAELSAAEAEQPAQEAALAVATHRLAVLLGRSPSDFEAPASVASGPHAVKLRLPEPAQWVAQRPDLRSAEAQLRAHALDVAAVRSEFMPKLSVAGMLGFVAGSVSGIGAVGSASWFVAPSLSIPVFDVGRIDARLQAARASQREALWAYRQCVLLATEEVEGALVQVRQGQLRLAALHDRARHAVTAERFARKRFEAGGADLLELLDAQRGAQQAELGLSAAMTTQRQQIVMLQRALGSNFLPDKG